MKTLKRNPILILAATACLTAVATLAGPVGAAPLGCGSLAAVLRVKRRSL